MEKKLLLLGILLSHDMHGYQLYDVIRQYAGIAITLKKSNAYKLLNDMEADGWVTHQEEQAGNRPPRRVYRVTDAGKAAFDRLLRQNVSSFPTPEFPGVVGLDFVQTLPRGDAIALLEQRRDAVTAKYRQLDEIAADIRQHHLSIAYLHQYYDHERQWLTDLLHRLRTSS